MVTAWKPEGSEFESRQGQEYSLFPVIQTDSGAHPASYPIGTVEKRPRCDADHSPPASAEVKKIWIYIYTPPYAFMALSTGITLLFFFFAFIYKVSPNITQHRYLLCFYFLKYKTPPYMSAFISCSRDEIYHFIFHICKYSHY
jgi:hypothetical protein